MKRSCSGLRTKKQPISSGSGSPVGPGDPCGPVGPGDPCGPVGPGDPCGPVGPVIHVALLALLAWWPGCRPHAPL